MKQVLIKGISGSLAVWMLAGCATTVGPKVLTNSQVEYNVAVQKVVMQEVLLNIVRRRYYEAPQFLTIASIVTQISNSRSAAINGSGQFNTGAGPDTQNYGLGLNGAVSYSDSPAISLVPRADEQVTKQLTQRMFYDTPQVLANVGYPYDLVFALTVESAGNVHGPQFGIERNFRPGTREYVELVGRLRSLIDKNQLIAGTVMLNDPYSAIAYTPDKVSIQDQMTAVGLGTGMGRFRSFDGGKSYYFTDQNYYSFLWIDEAARDTEDGKRIIKLLNLTPDPLYRVWKVENCKVPGGGPDFNWQKNAPPTREYLNLWPRSFYSVLNYLAFSVQVPEEEEQEGRAFSLEAYEKAVADGLAVDLTKYFTVRWSKSRPKNAFVEIQHRGKWFYIDDRDADSKRFFNAVYDLFNITIAPPSQSPGPVLTLPLK